MKRINRLLHILPLACAVLAAAGCKDKIAKQWDYPNENIRIYVVNERGEDLMAATTNGTLFYNQGVGASYNGESYPCLRPSPPGSRASQPVLPEFEGLTWRLGVNPRHLTFGEFSIDTREYKNEKFTIRWGSRDGVDFGYTEFEFDFWRTENGDEQPTIHRAIRATDGVGVGTSADNSLAITITRPSSAK
jgi:hypothetical protein